MTLSLFARPHQLFHRAMRNTRFASANGSLFQLPKQALLFQQQYKRTFAGGPRNPEHKIRLKKQKQAKRAAAKQDATEKPRRAKNKKQHHKGLLKFLDKPVSSKLQPFMADMESYILKEWIVQFPLGAGVRKLQRDVQFRMKPRKISPGRLEYEELVPVVGELVRKGALDTRLDNQRGKLVIVGAASTTRADKNKQCPKDTDSSSQRAA